ncbi:MAG: hypothetical protein IT254_10140 [Chitinophagaceae bacterium]|nr:hypothetical protein [Bacteroidota bacterium]MCC6258672.1 hypothetical protein [Chitinophagaceae bacterium]MCW5916992.1 hypothetical protein [Ferruginibacter sp.]
MKKIFFLLLISCLTAGILFSCKKSTQDFITPAISKYVPLEVGKYIVYRLDSLVFVDFGTNTQTHSYEVKYEVSDSLTDNLNRKAFRITRFIRVNNTQNWTPDNTFMAVNYGTGYEFVENNLRFIKLKQPIRNDYSWKGNSFIDTYSTDSPVRYMDDWDYVYADVGQPLQLTNFSLPNTITVNERDEVIGNPDDPQSYAEKNISKEVYAEDIGLVYRQFLHTEYQPPVTGSPGHFVDGSYGVTLEMIDHN